MTFWQVTECNVCGGRDLQEIFSLPAFPLILRPVSDELKRNLQANHFPLAMPLRFGVCQSCSHLFLLLRPVEEVLRDLYAKLYVNYVSGLELGFATTDSDEFLDVFSRYLGSRLPAGSRALEIGCYDGYILSRLADSGFDVVGCDPSDGARIGGERGLPIVRDFFSPDLFLPDQFDVVINRHLIEHFMMPATFIGSIGKICKSSGYVIIETPNGAHYLRHGLLDPFHLEHLSVFTPASLAACVRQAGLRIDEMSSGGRNLIALCTPEPASAGPKVAAPGAPHMLEQARSFSHQLIRYLSEIESLVQDLTRRGSTLAVWGAGSLGVSLLTLMPALVERAVAIVDRDPRKHGLSFYNLDVQITPPEYLKEHPADYIIVCSQYGEEIVRDIRERYGLGSSIVLVTPKIEVVE